MTEFLQARVEELEIKVAFQEDLLRQLDEVLQHLYARIERAEQEVSQVRQDVNRAAPGSTGLADDKPPHYGS